MSVVDQLKNLFAKKTPDSESEAGLSLSEPDATVDPAATVAMPSREEVEAEFSIASPPDDNTPGMDADLDSGDLVSLPILGRRTVQQHQQVLAILLAFALVVLGAVTFFTLNVSGSVAQQLSATGQALMQSQRLAKTVSQAFVGGVQAFPDVRQSSDALARSVRGLKSGDDEMRLSPLDAEHQGELDKIMPLVERAEKNASTVMAQKDTLTQAGGALRQINRQSADLLEIAESISSLKLERNAPPGEISAAGQLVMLTQRIGKSSNELLSAEGVSPEAVFLLGKDLNSFKEIGQGLLDGSAELRLSPSRDPQIRNQLQALLKLYEETRAQAGGILGNLQGRVRLLCPSLPIVTQCGWASKSCKANCPGGQGLAKVLWRFWLWQQRSPCYEPPGLPMCSCRTAVNVRLRPKLSEWMLNVRNRKPNASMMPIRRPFCG